MEKDELVKTMDELIKYENDCFEGIRGVGMLEEDIEEHIGAYKQIREIIIQHSEKPKKVRREWVEKNLVKACYDYAKYSGKGSYGFFERIVSVLKELGIEVEE